MFNPRRTSLFCEASDSTRSRELPARGRGDGARRTRSGDKVETGYRRSNLLPSGRATIIGGAGCARTVQDEKLRTGRQNSPEVGRLYLARLMISRWGCGATSRKRRSGRLDVKPSKLHGASRAATAICISDYMPFPDGNCESAKDVRYRAEAMILPKFHPGGRG
jgi:hypothetical protein